ncbi:MAG: hypothetical protein VB081_14820 [Christensenella sp.]|uniref:hypothetical protein n=1 Tax=Christensenella sp. TaxID=1935934 RepID=UPI002B1FB777|nr:hypothetical protein [Christensenella sp.]MEA5004758.1 hypothetical protein [Christensenella sp.]
MKRFDLANLDVKWRYLIMMVICVALNEVLYLLAQAFGLPLWLDLPGTALAALALEPAAGLLVGLMNDFFIAVTSLDASAILYYAASAAVALIVGINMRREDKPLRRRILTTILYVIIATTVIASLLTLLRNGGVPADNVWEMRFYNAALAWDWSNVAACFFATFLVKVFDAFATAGIVALFYRFMPKALKNPLQLYKV